MMDTNTKNEVYRTIVENLGVEIFVSDGEGNILFANPASIEINELDVDNVIGRNVRELIDEGYFYESSTLRVLKENQTVSVLQHLKNGKQVIATGVPIYDEDGNIELVISTSQDIEAVNELLDTLEQQEQELRNLKRELSFTNRFETVDPASYKIKNTLEKVASLDIPVLISGETGTGKHTAARHIHFFGKRSDHPFLTVNCSNTDADALEQEIFGVELPSDDGKTRQVRQGKLDMATGGTLVLVNIAYTSKSIQSRLFDYLETGRFRRINGSEEHSSTARIIAIAGPDLSALRESDTFMRPLYYRLAGVLINIPPLRDRIKDIPFLAGQYVSRYNDKYHQRKTLNRDALGKLTSHNWPGNLIELNQIIEAAYLMTDGPVIQGDTIYEVLHSDQSSDMAKPNVYCDDIIPLKEAKHQLEEQLVKRAFEVYGTTHRTAEALKVNQSTVSRILNKYSK